MILNLFRSKPSEKSTPEVKKTKKMDYEIPKNFFKIVEKETANGKISVDLYSVDPCVGMYETTRRLYYAIAFDTEAKWHYLFGYNSKEEARKSAQLMYNNMRKAQNACKIVRTEEEYIS